MAEIFNTNESDTKDGKVSDECQHTLRIDSLCAICGAEVPKDFELVPVSHNSDHLFQTINAAKKNQKRRNRILEKQKKMILILDLDQTILHSSMDEADCDHSFTIQNTTFYVKFRPHLTTFLRKANKLFEMHIYTMGTRDYAEAICRFIDPDKSLFSDRIVSRSENFNELKKSVERITCISKNVLILDDRIDVWNYSSNLIPIKPFWYYNKIDINNPMVIRRKIVGDSKISVKKELQSSEEEIMESYSDEFSENSSELKVKRDNELKRIFKVISCIHRKYFAEKCSAKKLIKLKVLRKRKFICNKLYENLVLFSGGSISDVNPDFAIENREYAMKYAVPNVSSTWIFDCVFERKFIEPESYIIDNFDGLAEYQKELEDEFFSE